MPRFWVVILTGLILAGSSRAQKPGEDFNPPQPTPVAAQPVETAPDPAAPPMESEPTPYFSTGSNGWRFWASADYAEAWIKGKNLPPLATTSPPGTSRALAGVLGVPGNSADTLIGGSPINEAGRSVGKLDFGFWIDPERSLGVAAGFFVSDSLATNIGATSDGTTILARPFVDTNIGPSSVLVGFPGVSSGSVNVYAASQTFWGANLDFQESIISASWFRLESLIGYRFLHYGERLDMQQSLLAIGAPFIPGTQIVSGDSFQTMNDFHGGEFGFRTGFFGERWSLELLTKLAVGNMRREVIINGSTQTTLPGVTTTNDVGGVYALASYIGTHRDNAWKIAPELGLTLEYQVTSNVRCRLGYSFLYLQDVGRAADQIDFVLNQNLFPPAIPGGTARPAFRFAGSDIWINSINFGLEFRF